jgi:hypothetical protein
MKFSTFLKEANEDKKALLAKLKSALLMGQPAGSAKISGRDIQEEDNSLSIRYWGKWEMPEGEEDDGDYDWEVLSAASSKKLKEVITAFEKANKCKVDCQTSEKNWIECSIK